MLRGVHEEYSGHSETWGTFIDAKVNAPELLEKDLLPMKDSSVFAKRLDPHVDLIYLDKMNYQRKVIALYRAKGWEKFLEDEYFSFVVAEFKKATDKDINVLF